MTKRKFLFVPAALLLFIISAAFFGCTGKRQVSPSAGGPVTITFWHSMSDNAVLAFDEFVREFNAGSGADKQIRVDAVFQGQYADATAKLRPLLGARQVNALPDVMQIDATGITDYLNTEFAFTIDDALAVYPGYDLGQIMEAPLLAWNYGGRQLGLPVSASTTVMYYNRTILDAAGITNPPTSFDEIIEISRRLPAMNINNQRLAAFAQQPNTPLLASWIGQMPGRTAGASYVTDNRNGRDGDATRLVCDTEGTLLNFLGAWKNMFDTGALLNVSDGLNNLFLTQQIVFMTSSTSALLRLLNQIDGRFELGCTFFPRVNDNSNFGATVSGSGLFMFNKGDAAKTRAAWEFVQFMCSPDIQARFSVSTGYIPVNLASLDKAIYTDHIARFPQAETGTRQLEQTNPDMMGIIVGPSRNFFFEIISQVSAMLTNNRTPEDTVRTMTSALNLLLDDYIEANR